MVTLRHASTGGQGLWVGPLSAAPLTTIRLRHHQARLFRQQRNRQSHRPESETRILCSCCHQDAWRRRQRTVNICVVCPVSNRSFGFAKQTQSGWHGLAACFQAAAPRSRRIPCVVQSNSPNREPVRHQVGRSNEWFFRPRLDRPKRQAVEPIRNSFSVIQTGTKAKGYPKCHGVLRLMDRLVV